MRTSGRSLAVGVAGLFMTAVLVLGGTQTSRAQTSQGPMASAAPAAYAPDAGAGDST